MEPARTNATADTLAMLCVANYCSHLQAGFSCASALGKDLDDEADPVRYGTLPGRLQVPLLHSAQHAIHKHPAAGRSITFPCHMAVDYPRLRNQLACQVHREGA